MINTIALKVFRDNWDVIKRNTNGKSNEQIADIKDTANNYDKDGDLDKAIAGINKIDTTDIDAIKKFSEDNGFEYLGDIGKDYACLGYERYTKSVSQNKSAGIEVDDPATVHNEYMPAWMRDNSLPSMQMRAISGKLHDYSVLMFVDRVTVGYSNEGSGEMFSYNGVIAVSLNKIFPQIVLDSNKNDKWFLKTRSAAIDKAQKINLEADFSQYYDFYSPKGINANTLSVLAPNFMHMLIKSSATFDVEFYGDKMYIITQDPLFTEKVMNDAVLALEEQLQYMNRLEQSWNYQPVNLPFDTLKQTKIANFYSIKIGKHRIGAVQLILAMFALIFIVMLIVPLIITAITFLTF